MSVNPENLNREQKRMMQRTGMLDASGNPARAERRPVTDRAKEPRTPPAQYLNEVRAEMNKVAWPTRDQVRSYSIIVLITVLFLTALVFGLDWLFQNGVLRLFDK
jgi:preprotein translocase subunit SecE